MISLIFSLNTSGHGSYYNCAHSSKRNSFRLSLYDTHGRSCQKKTGTGAKIRKNSVDKCNAIYFQGRTRFWVQVRIFNAVIQYKENICLGERVYCILFMQVRSPHFLFKAGGDVCVHYPYLHAFIGVYTLCNMHRFLAVVYCSIFNEVEVTVPWDYGWVSLV